MPWKIAIIKAPRKWTFSLWELKLTCFVWHQKGFLELNLACSLNIYKTHSSVTSQAWIVYVLRAHKLRLCKTLLLCVLRNIICMAWEYSKILYSKVQILLVLMLSFSDMFRYSWPIVFVVGQLLLKVDHLIITYILSSITTTLCCPIIALNY